MNLRDRKKTLTVIDHTEQRWQYRYRTHGRENGASTYSKEIVEHHIPLWADAVKGLDTVISTCPRMLNMDIEGDLAVQYLHTYSYKEGLHNIRLIDKQLQRTFQKRIFVTAYRSLAIQANNAGYETWHVPMAIDPSKINPVVADQKKGERTAAYFGNLLGNKVDSYAKLKIEFQKNGWALDRVAGPQRDSWHELTKYDYGVGVGRCALEMLHLGLRVMISGAHFGGIMMDSHDFEVQRNTNFNGRTVTFDREIQACISAWNLSIKDVTVDIPYATEVLAEYLAALGA